MQVIYGDLCQSFGKIRSHADLCASNSISEGVSQPKFIQHLIGKYLRFSSKEYTRVKQF